MQSAGKLLEHADSLIGECEFATAHKFLLRALALEPENAVVLETLGEVLVELGDMSNALEYFKRSIELSPHVGGFARYMYLGQMSAGEEAFGYFGAGAEAMTAALAQAIDHGAPADEIVGIRLALARAYTAQAELFLTDACEAPNAESEAERFVGLAMEADPDGFEPLQTLASVRVSQCRNDEAVALLDRCVTCWQAIDEHDPRRPSPEFRVTSARLAIELDLVPVAGAILEALVGEDDSIVEAWYLLGLCMETVGEIAPAAEALLRAQYLLTAGEIDEPTLAADIAERLTRLGAALAEVGESLDDYAPLPEDVDDPLAGVAGAADDDGEMPDDDDGDASDEAP